MDKEQLLSTEHRLIDDLEGITSQLTKLRDIIDVTLKLVSDTLANIVVEFAELKNGID